MTRQFHSFVLPCLASGLLLVAYSTASGQGTGQNAGGGTAAGGLDVGSEIEGRLVDPNSVFDVDRGDSVGASSATVAGFSTVGGAGGGGAGGAGAGGGGFGGMGGLGGLGGLFGGAFNQFNQSQQTQNRAVRTRLRSAVQVSPVDPNQVQANLQRRINTNPTANRFRGSSVAVDGRTATLSGQVGSEADSRMAQLLMRLEPGVSRVQNNLQIAAPNRQPMNGQPTYGQPQRNVSPSDWNPLPTPSN